MAEATHEEFMNAFPDGIPVADVISILEPMAKADPVEAYKVFARMTGVTVENASEGKK